MADDASTAGSAPFPCLEIDPSWAGKVLDREVLSVSGSSLGHIYQSFATAGGAEPLTGWGIDILRRTWTPSATTDVVWDAGVQVTSGSPPSATKYDMGSWSGKLTKSLAADQAIFEIYEAKLTAGTWGKTGSRLGVVVVRSDGLEYHKAASVSTPPTSISGDRNRPLFFEAHSSIDLDPGAGNCWWCAVDPQV